MNLVSAHGGGPITLRLQQKRQAFLLPLFHFSNRVCFEPSIILCLYVRTGSWVLRTKSLTLAYKTWHTLIAAPRVFSRRQSEETRPVGIGTVDTISGGWRTARRCKAKAVNWYFCICSIYLGPSEAVRRILFTPFSPSSDRSFKPQSHPRPSRQAAVTKAPRESCRCLEPKHRRLRRT